MQCHIDCLCWHVGGGGPKVFLDPISNGLHKVFLITGCMGALKPVDNPTLLSDGILVLGGYQQVMDGVVSFEVNVYPTLLHAFLKFPLKPLL